MFHNIVLLQVLSSISNSERIIPTSVEFVDIAGLVKGASKGEGLGNQFLANIRECDAIAQVWMASCNSGQPFAWPFATLATAMLH